MAAASPVATRDGDGERVARRSHDQRHGDREEAVLGELRGADEACPPGGSRRSGVVRAPWPRRRASTSSPAAASVQPRRAERLDAEPAGGGERGDDDDHQRDVGSAIVTLALPSVDGTPGCSARMDGQEGARRPPARAPRSRARVASGASTAAPILIVPMASRDIRRRAVTAAALYGGTAAGILGTLIAVRVLGPDQFGVFTLALAAASFVQLLLDTTVEEAIVKYGVPLRGDGRLGPAARPLPGRACRQVGRRRGRDARHPRARALRRRVVRRART